VPPELVKLWKGGPPATELSTKHPSPHTSVTPQEMTPSPGEDATPVIRSVPFVSLNCITEKKYPFL